MRSKHQRRIDQFMILAKQNMPNVPTVPSREVAKLRAMLIMEEAMETIEALGVEVLDAYVMTRINFADMDFNVYQEANLVDVADGCADLSVVTIGTLSACGISDEPLLTVVDENNLAKFAPGHSWSPEGKLVKPPGHPRPDIEAALRNEI